MTSALASRVEGLTRCAVCKIDLRGRFVYIDQEFEKLLGATAEEMFGRNVQEYLDETSQVRIGELLAERNHYETFYEATDLTLLGRSGVSRTVRAVASLNFIAGNPVNFQLVLDPHSGSDDQVTARALAPLSDFLGRLIGADNLTDFRHYLGHLRRFAGASQAAVYLIGDDTLELRSASSDDVSAEFAFKSIPEPTALHSRVARTGEPYSVTFDSAVRQAIESDGAAPAEFITLLPVGRDRTYLLRLIYPENLEGADAIEAVARTQQVLSLMDLMQRASHADATEDNAVVNVQFTIGFLDHLGIGALLIGEQGEVVGYNPVLRELLDGNEPGESLDDFLRVVSTREETDIAGAIKRRLAGDAPSADGGPDLRPTMPSGDVVRLEVVSLSESPDSRSCCIVAIPVESGVTDLPEETIRVWRGAMEAVLTAANDLGSAADALHQQYSGELDEGSLKSFRGLIESSGALRGQLNNLAEFLQPAPEHEAPAPVDLCPLVEEIIHDLGAANPSRLISCDHQGLPVVIAPPSGLQRVIRSVFSDAIALNSGEQVRLSLAAGHAADSLQLTICDHSISVSEEALTVRDDRAAGFALTRQFVGQLGGRIDLGTASEGGLQVSIEIPVGRA